MLFVILLAAALHAGWNALVKTGPDKLAAMTQISAASGLIALCGLPFVEVPAGPVWYYILASALLHTVYRLVLVKAYGSGDLGQVYPLARGAAPLLVTLAGLALPGALLSGTALAGVLILIAGIVLMSFRGGTSSTIKPDRGAVLYALMTSVMIASYTLVDGMGARVGGDALSFTLWLFAIDCPLTVLVASFGLRGRFLSSVTRSWQTGLAGGGMSMAAYGLCIWAMTVLPIPVVAALRETSVLFAVLIARVWMKELLSLSRLLAVLAIIAGVVLLRLDIGG